MHHGRRLPHRAGVHLKRILVAGGLVAAAGLVALLVYRSPTALDRASPVPHQSETATGAEPARAPPRTPARPERRTQERPPAAQAIEAQGGGAPRPGPRVLGADAPEAEWEALQLDRNYGESLGPEGVERFNETLRKALDGRGCAMHSQWSPPPHLRAYEAEYEIRLAPIEGGFVVVDAKLHDGNASDDRVESCYREAWLGQRMEFLEHTPGTSARVLFPVRVSYRRVPRDAAP